MRRRRVLGLAGALIAAAAAIVAAGASLQTVEAATSTKYYTVGIQPTQVAAGSTGDALTLTLANCDGGVACSPASTQSLGSANVTPAPGFAVRIASLSVTSAGGKSWTAQVVSGVIELRAASSKDTLAPGDSLRVPLSVDAPCTAPAQPAWLSEVKQSNSFNGPPGNDFVNAGIDPTVGLTPGGGPLDHFAIAVPATATAGAPFNPTVTAIDRCGNTAAYTGPATLSGDLDLAPNGTAPTIPSPISVVDGVATPSVTAVDAEPNRTLTVGESGYPSTTSAPFTVAAAAPDHLGFTQQPPRQMQKSTAFSAAVTVYDAFGNVAVQAGQAVALALVQPSDPLLGGGGTLSGATSVTPASGVAGFGGLAVDIPGMGYALTASYPGVPDTTSDPFDVFDFYGSCSGGCQAGDSATNVAVQLPHGFSGNVGLGLNAHAASCAALSSLGSLAVVTPPPGDASYDITVTLTIQKPYRHGLGVANIAVCKTGSSGTDLVALPPCPNQGQPTQSCVLSRTSDNAGNAVLTFLIDSDDPLTGGFG